MESLFAIKFSYLIPLLPLLGAAISGFLGAKWLKANSHWPIWLGVGSSAVLSFMLLFGMLARWHGEAPHEVEIERSADGHSISLKTESDPKKYREERTKTLQANSLTKDWFTWIEAGLFKATAGFYFDSLTAVMLCVVTGIGFLITVFAKGYMVGESGYFRFFAYLGLFIFAMTILVMGNNFLMLYMGWEGVGLCSYLLIGYFYEKPAAREAAKKAFLVNRIGDFGFGLGIMLIYLCFGTISFYGQGAGTETGVLELAQRTLGYANLIPGMTPWKSSLIPCIPFLLMLGAFGKSAQLPLYVWLPDAMEGPTPVSALIHAATMVTAGIYMIVRCGTLFIPNQAAMWTIAVVGTLTALFAATIALRQYDLKKVFAYSTISQLGFMFAGAGVFASVPAVFHLVTHAFFKALLFLSSGVVMHGMMGHLDMRKMSGLKRVLPKTNILMLIGCLALAGVPFFSGFFSKDEIVAAVWDQSKILGALLLITAFLTAYYTFRLYFRVFQGPLILPKGPAEGHATHDDHNDHSHDHAHTSHDDSHAHEHHNHEPSIMILPLVVLAIGAVLAGYLNWPERHTSLHGFLASSPSLILGHEMGLIRYGSALSPGPMGFEEVDKSIAEKIARLHLYMMIISGLIVALGIYVAYLYHLKYRDRAEPVAAKFRGLVRVLDHKYWVDEIYKAAVIEPLRSMGRVFFAIDRIVIDGLIWTVSFIPQMFGFTLKLTTQRGSLQGYALMMLLGLAVILLVVFL